MIMTKKRKIFITAVCVLCLILLAFAAVLLMVLKKNSQLTKTPSELLVQYTQYIEEQKYSDMYEMLSKESQDAIDSEAFLKRNKNIYEGIGANSIEIEILEVKKGLRETAVSYHTSMNTVAGKVEFDNQATFQREDLLGQKLVWEDSLIFPNLEEKDKVLVETEPATRGEILDRNGFRLAGMGTASSVGLVPGKMQEDAGKDIRKLSELLELSEEFIENQLNASWVKLDTFVPLKTLKKVKDPVTGGEKDESDMENELLQEELLKIPGVAITDIVVRQYPLGKAAAHLVGYVQNVTAEDLEEHRGEGYRTDSVIGRSGMEALFEKELKGEDGHKITIVNSHGGDKEVVALNPRKDGETITLTIDKNLQTKLYQQYREDESCSVAMNPLTGEVLALVSTPSYDDNDFILGLSQSQWNQLNDDPAKPMYNRFRQIWCPGSSFKPITAAVGLTTGAIDPNQDYGSEGLSWQKDDTWGDYHVTTLHDYSPVTMENALIYSDNIYFAKTALRIGADSFVEQLRQLGFREKMPFEITMTQSQYSNSEGIESEPQLADSGYGQGQILINPLHLASLYTAFVNDGNVLAPYLEYKEQAAKTVWISEACSSEHAQLIRDALVKVVNDPAGTGYGAARDDVVLAGKTGTAEIKASAEDPNGTELGWFGIFTVGKEASKPILLMTMVEDVKERKGSGYVVEQSKAVLDWYFQYD